MELLIDAEKPGGGEGTSVLAGARKAGPRWMQVIHTWLSGVGVRLFKPEMTRFEAGIRTVSTNYDMNTYHFAS